MRLYVEPTGSSTAVDEPQVDDPLVDALAALCRSLVDVTARCP